MPPEDRGHPRGLARSAAPSDQRDRVRAIPQPASQGRQVTGSRVPELPEVETVVRSIAPLVGRCIVSAEFRCRRVLRGADPRAMAARIEGRRIAGVRRMEVHPGVAPGWRIPGDSSGHDRPPPARRPGGQAHPRRSDPRRGRLLYDDSRQFGCIQFQRGIPGAGGETRPEPLEVSFEDFAAALKRRKTRIKALLLNQGFLRGLGNIYADEALFRAGIHPLAVPSRLPRDRARGCMRRLSRC